MAKVKVVGEAVVVVSEIGLDEMVKLKKFKPSGLQLVDAETKDVLFAAGIGDTASFTKFGITFTGKNQEGKASTTLTIPTGMDNDKKKAFVQDNYGYGILALAKLEEQILFASDELATEFNTMASAIEIN